MSILSVVTTSSNDATFAEKSLIKSGSIFLTMSKTERSLNPANLRWKYLLEDVRDETNAKEVDTCLESLHRFPLVTLVHFLKWAVINS